MATDPFSVQHLVLSPSESLNVELKAWFDPAKPEAIAKIAKGCIALRNRNGGYFVVGIDDATLQPLAASPAVDVRAVFHIDKIQEVVSKYASDPFELEVVFVQSELALHPVIIIPTGVRVPVAVRKALSDGKAELLKVGEVPFRTLNANNRASTAAARPEDWRDIVAICFDNREADVAGFVRRHLSGLTLEILENFVGFPIPTPPPSLAQVSAEFRNECWSRFKTCAQNADRGSEVARGGWEVALVLSPELDGFVSDQNFIDRVFAANPNYSSWPIWLDTRNINGADLNVRNGGWESFVVLDSWYKVFDFYRFEPAGRFYACRPDFDDGMASARKTNLGKTLDPVPLIADVGEALALGLLFARTLGASPDTKLGFSLRWSGLSGRQLVTLSPADLGAHLIGQFSCQDDDVSDFVVVPADASPLAVAPYVATCTRRLLAAFNGFSVRAANVDRIVESRLNRERP